MTILSSFTHPQVVSNLYEFIYFAEHRILKNVGNQTVDVLHWLYPDILRNICVLLCLAEEINSYIWNNLRVSQLFWSELFL